MQIVSSFVQSILVIFAFKSIFVAAQFVFRWMQMLFYSGSLSRHFSAHWLHQGGNTFHFSKRAIQRDMQIGRCCQKKYFQFATNCELRWPNMFSQTLTEKKTNKENLTKDTTTTSKRGSESIRVGIQHYFISAQLVFFYTVPIESCTTMDESSIVCPSGHLSNFCANSSFKVAFV